MCREAERTIVEESDESAGAAGHDTNAQTAGDWERVARLCDFNPKNSKCAKDVGRFRSLLLQLKQSGGGTGTVANSIDGAKL